MFDLFDVSETVSEPLTSGNVFGNMLGLVSLRARVLEPTQNGLGTNKVTVCSSFFTVCVIVCCVLLFFLDFFFFGYK